MADAAAVGLWFVAREARRHVKVVLSGEGADELFGGYGVYYQPGVVRAATKLRPRAVARRGDGRPDTVRAEGQGAARADRDTAAHPVHRQRQRLLRRGNRRADQVRRRHRLRRDRPALRPGRRRRARRRGHHAARRHQHLAAWRHPGQGRPRVDGARPGAAHAVPRPRGDVRWRAGWRGRRRPPRARPSSRCARRWAACCRRRARSAASSASPCRSGTGSAASCPATPTR